MQSESTSSAPSTRQPGVRSDSEELLASTQRAARAGSWIWEIDTGRVTWSEELYRLFGLPRETTPSFETWLNLVHPEDRPGIKALVRRSLETRQPLDCEFRVVLPDGTLRWFSGPGEVCCDAEGRPWRMLGLALDITERKSSERLRGQHQELTRITETAPVMLWCALPDGSADYFNPAWLEHCGMTMEQAQGSGWQAAVHPDDLEPTLRAWADACEHVRDFEVETRLRRHDGVYTWFLVRARPSLSPDGAILKWYGANVDISERKRAAQELEATNQAYADLYNRVPCGYHSINASGTIVAINDTQLAMHGYSREEVVGRMNIRDLVDAPSRAHFEGTFPEFMKKGWIRNIEATLLRKDGSGFPVLVSADAKFGPDGTFQHSFTTVIDDTERREALNALLVSRRDLEARVVERTAQVRALAEELTLAEDRERRAIAHDLHDGLGQVLFAASLKLDLLSREAAPCEHGKATLLELKETLADARKMLRSISLQLSPLVLETLGLVAALSWLGDELRNTYALGVELVDEGGAESLSPTASMVLYRSARELLINVVKHAGVREAIVLISSEDGHVSLQVEDFGAGIADVEGVLQAGHTYGLRAIRERLAFLGGAFHLWSRPGAGTMVTLKVPASLGASGEIP